MLQETNTTLEKSFNILSKAFGPFRQSKDFLAKLSIGIVFFSLIFEPFIGSSWKLAFLVSCLFISKINICSLLRPTWDSLLILTLSVSAIISHYTSEYSPDTLAVIKILIIWVTGRILAQVTNIDLDKIFSRSVGLAVTISIIFFLVIGVLKLQLWKPPYNMGEHFRLRLFSTPNTLSFYLLVFLGLITFKANKFRFRLAAIPLFIMVCLAGSKPAIVTSFLLPFAKYFFRRDFGTLRLQILSLLTTFTALTFISFYKINNHYYFKANYVLTKTFARSLGLPFPNMNSLEEDSDGFLIKKNLNGRSILWRVGISGIAERPFIGWGRRSYPNYFELNHEKILKSSSNKLIKSDISIEGLGKRPRSTHNFPMGIAFEFGIATLVLFYCMLIIGIARAFKGNQYMILSWFLVILIYPIGHYFVYRPVVELTIFLYAFLQKDLVYDKGQSK